MPKRTIPIAKMRGWMVCPACVEVLQKRHVEPWGACPRCDYSTLETLAAMRSDKTGRLWDDVNVPGLLRALEAGEFPVMEIEGA